MVETIVQLALASETTTVGLLEIWPVSKEELGVVVNVVCAVTDAFSEVPYDDTLSRTELKSCGVILEYSEYH